jgi:hypothetical protein
MFYGSNPRPRAGQIAALGCAEHAVKQNLKRKNVLLLRIHTRALPPYARAHYARACKAVNATGKPLLAERRRVSSDIWPIGLAVLGGHIMARLNAKEEWFRRVATANHRGLEWRPILDYPTDALAREARSADLVVI